MPKKKKTLREQSQKLIEVKAYLGKDFNGERIQKSFYGKTKSEAKEKAKEYKDLYNSGEAITSDITLIEWTEKWLKAYKEKNIKSSTYAFKYKSFFETHLKPYFKSVKISKVSPLDIQLFINSKSNVSQETQKRYLNILKSIFNSAIDNNLLIKNPVKNITLKSNVSQKEKRTYTKEEVSLIIEFAKTHDYGTSIITFLKTGLRRGELLALQWEDIDFQNKIIYVKRSVADIPVNGTIKTVVEDNSNSTKNHNRMIPFDDELHEVLVQKQKASIFVFPNSKGNINSPNNYSRKQYAYFMKDLLVKYPFLTKLNAHELRHTYGTLLYENNVDLRVIQKVMGHSDLKITSEIYIHDNIEFIKKELSKQNTYENYTKTKPV